MPYTHTEEKGGTLLQVHAKSYNDLFAEAARGFFSLFHNVDAVKEETRVKVVVDSKDLESLFSSWLTELVEREDINQVSFGEFRVASVQKVSSSQYLLTGEAFGENKAADAEGSKKLLSKIKSIKVSEEKGDGGTTVYKGQCIIEKKK